METSEEEPKYCGNCLHFKDEDVNGNGYCAKSECSTFCGFYACEEWKRKED